MEEKLQFKNKNNICDVEERKNKKIKYSRY